MHIEGVVEGVIPCLKSADDTVRIAAVECLEYTPTSVRASHY